MNPHVWWYLARSTGIVAWLLLSASVIWGLLLSTRLIRRRSAPKWLLDLHRFLGGLSISFLGLHLATIVADSYVHFGARDLFVPFASSWKPVPVSLGVFALYLVIAVEVSSLAMRRLPRRLWRRIHLSSFAGFVLATAHGLSAGTDRSNLALFAANVVVVAVVLFLTVFRVLAEPTRRTKGRSALSPTPADSDTRPHVTATVPASLMRPRAQRAHPGRVR